MTNLTSNKNLPLLWSAQTISQAGDSIYQLALLWLVLDMTNSSIITGIVAMSAYLPALIFGLYAGVFSDRFNRLHLMIFSNGGQAIVVLMIPLFLWYGYDNVWMICGLAFIRSCFNTFFQPAFNSFIPMLFPSNRLVRINTILATSGQLAWMMGPFLAGILLTMVSLPSLFLVDSISFLIGIGLLLFIKKPTHIQSVENHSHWVELKRGLLYLYKNKPIFWMMNITFINNLCIMGPAIVGLPILVRNTLDGSASDFAFVEGSMAVGALFGSFLVSKLNGKILNGKIWGIGLFLDGITYTLIYWVSSVEMAMVMLFFHGIGIPLIMVSRTSIIQVHTPNKFHGRLFSIVHLGVVGTTAISAGLVGIITSIISVKLLFIGIGIGAAFCGIIALSLPSIRNIQ
ncbi:MAG: MFS transporter [Candidatus Marinimicrobia bacterium]|jgi:MFS family permease|nr:MFS transporter [Candidatus Neomarinimicrobiota bacterium]MBT3839010.1 MFS transporter [Candidatus Neomarinimicrobiota bacterium]MBT3999315.1 MFS transporter [Candidatus Neomarinimicrobiota bacterium]MBT4282733.1 MFS transporter [Candidatus Neomarinimicrobiota bacterium]MBT4578297.1 MFS transporter [Candidatus Neomarinimicrobiota bacterium]